VISSQAGMAPESSECTVSHARSSGLIGMLVIDRDAHLLPQVLQHLQAALSTLCTNCINQQSADDADRRHGIADGCEKCEEFYDIDLVVSTREIDRKARAAIEQHCPDKIRRLEFLTANYDACFSNHYHSDAVLEAICSQRNDIRKYALQQERYKWLFFLDSDILLQPSSLLSLIRTKRHCIGAAYMPRWSRHVVVGVNQINKNALESHMQLLLNPHLLRSNADSIPCSIIGFGATLVRSSLLHIPYRIQESIGNVKGEDIGFCIDLLALGDVDYQPYILADHYVVHLAGGACPSPFIPDLDHEYPLLTHIRTDQLYWVDNNLSIEWQVHDEGRTVLSAVSHLVKEKHSSTVPEQTALCEAIDSEAAKSLTTSSHSKKSDSQTVSLTNDQNPKKIEQTEILDENELVKGRFLRLLARLQRARSAIRCPEPIVVERLSTSSSSLSFMN
jgi:hypothetical protein